MRKKNVFEIYSHITVSTSFVFFLYINIKKIVMAHLMLKFDIILTSISQVSQQWTKKAIFYKIYCHK